jgi:antitoxin ParD1/3/4
VARGDFASAEDAARQLIDERIAEHALEEQDDLAWAKPHVDEALTKLRSRAISSAVKNIERATPFDWPH